MRLRGGLSGGGWLALLALLNTVLGVGLFALRSPVHRDTHMPPPALPAQVVALEGRMDGQHRGEPYTLTLTDDELSTAVAVFLAGSPEVPFGDVHVAVTGGRIVVTGTARGTAVGVPVRANLLATAQGGQPIVQLDNVSLGSTPLPTFIRQQVIAQANASLDLSQYNLGVTVDSLTLGEGVLTVRGTIT